MEFNEHNSLQFEQFRETVGVNNVKKSPHVSNVNKLNPGIVSNDMNLDIYGGGNSNNNNLSNIRSYRYALDTVSNLNMNVYHVNNSPRGLHRAPGTIVFRPPQHGSPPPPVVAHMKTDHQPSSQSINGSIHRVDRLNYKFIDQSDNSENQFVYLHNYPQNKPGGFYFLKTIIGTSEMYIFESLSHPVGALFVCESFWLCINPAVSNSHNTLDKQEAARVYDNHMQDLLSKQKYGMSYDEYIQYIIDSLIESQGTADIIDQTVNTNLTRQKAKDTSPKVHKPPQVHTDRRPTKHFHKDINYPTKTWGYISLQPTEFEFIGPDRPGVDPRNTSQYIHLAKVIHESGLPNYKQVRAPITSGINVEAWKRHLYDYKDQLIIQYLQFGFPLSIRERDSLCKQNPKNHFSAIQHSKAITDYLTKEGNFGAILGPIQNVTDCPIHCSPLLTRPKDTGKRRVILDLSFPPGQSLNDHIDRESFDASAFSLRFPSIDTIVHEISKYGDDVTLAKIDIERAFRNLRVDPADAMKLGIKWKDDAYIDAAVAFGWVHGSAAFQRVSDAVTFIAAKAGINMVAYIDDYIIISTKDTAQRHFDTLASILSQLGLPSNPHKQTPPCRALTCLGIKIDIDANTLSIDPKKLTSIYSECQAVRNKRHLTKKGFQSLLGKLLYLHKCVIPARIFINRMLALFRERSNERRIHLTSDFHKDLDWFLAFLPQFNGITCIKKPDLPYNHTLHIDASLTGLGGVWNNEVYASPIFNIYGMDLKIVHLEMLNLVIALKLWARKWSHSVVRFFCDNLAVVQVVRTGKTRDNMLSLCLRNIWLITATYDIDLHIEHIQGQANTIADILSRLYSPKPVNAQLLQSLSNSHHWRKIPIHFFNLNFSI